MDFPENPKYRGKVRLYLTLFGIFFGIPSQAQAPAVPGQSGQLSGNLQANANFFMRDTLIGAANTPQYDRQLFGTESWLNLNYSNWGFDFGFRFDVFNQSTLLNPPDSYSGTGIGNWFVRKTVDRLAIQAGYIYDQVGSGIVFRAYEERPQLIDNALVGLKLSYALTPEWQIRAFAGRQKQQFDTYRSAIRGIALDGFLSSGSDRFWWTSAPGIGIVARTLDDLSMNSLVATLNTYSSKDAFVPKYNAYAFTFFNTFSAGDFSWYVETAYKTREAINDPFARSVLNGDTVTGDRFVNKPGSVLYTTLSYSVKNLGLTLEAKRTERFSFRTRPQEQLNRGMIHFLPPMSRVNTYRLTSRYNAATQEQGELAFQADVRAGIGKSWRINLNASHIARLDQELLYREAFFELQRKIGRRANAIAGVQHQDYNQEIFEFKPGAGRVRTVTPFAEFQYKIDERHSWRAEAQFMKMGRDASGTARQDYGDWLFALAEFSIAPSWTFSLSDMYNIGPGRNSPTDARGRKLALHFPRADIFYRIKTNTFMLSYVKQVEGVVCTGGICRLEPAFSGVKFAVNSNF